MAKFDPVDSNLIRIIDDDGRRQQEVAELITSLNVSLTMDGSSQIDFRLPDPDLKYAAANTWQLRRDVFFRELMFEISSVEISSGSTFSPDISIESRSKQVQLMKRDKRPEAYSRISGTQFAAQVAERYGMNFFGEETPERQTIVKAGTARSDESVWDVLRRAAGEQQFVLFEIDNTLFFTSQEYLLGKWGDPRYQYQGKTFVPFGWPTNDDSVFAGSSARWIMLDTPTLRKSDDDAMQADGSMVVDRTNGVQLRPGMTIYLYGIPDFEDYYLITSVEWEEGTNNPVRVSFRTPVPFEERKGAGGGGEGQEVLTTLPAGVAQKVSTYVRSNLRKDTRNFDARDFDAIPGSFTRAVEETVSAVLGIAENIYAATTRPTKDDSLLAVANRYGFTSVFYLALQNVKQELDSNIETPGPRRLGSEKVIEDKIYDFLASRLGLPDTGYETVFNAIYNGAKADAFKIYNFTTRSGQDTLLNTFKQQYGATNIQYQVLEHVKPYIVFQPTLDDLDQLINLPWE
jgi:hypothetical protein